MSASSRCENVAVAAEYVAMRRRPQAHLLRGTRRGFTLIELVTVIVILGVLSSVAIPVYLDYTDDAKQSADEASIAAIRTALELVYVKHRMDEAASGEWITSVGTIENAMHGSQLPEGIEIVGAKLQDQRGNTYSFTAETADSAAKLTQDAPPPPGGS